MAARYQKTEYEIIRDMANAASDNWDKVREAWNELLEQEGFLGCDVAIAITELRADNRTERALRLLSVIENCIEEKLLQKAEDEREMDIAAAESRMGD